jgi:hypothetical protein
MKHALLACLLASGISSATACDLMGVEGHLSSDGQSITARQPIALKQQARRYGGYEEAAEYLERNRDSVLQDSLVADAVKQQVSIDLTENVKQLRCWVKVCMKNSADPVCKL